MSALLAEVSVEDGVVQLLPRVARIETDVAVLMADVSVLKVDVAVLKADVADLKVDVKELKVDVAGLKVDVSGLKEAVGDLRVNQARFGDDLRDLRSSLDTKFLWILSTMIAFGTALLAAMAEGFHWLK